jgi:hypothetical protein
VYVASIALENDQINLLNIIKKHLRGYVMIFCFVFPDILLPIQCVVAKLTHKYPHAPICAWKTNPHSSYYCVLKQYDRAVLCVKAI